MKFLDIAMLSAGILFVSVPVANAADLYEGSLKDTPVTYSPPITWGGFYVGGHIGVGFGGDCNKEEIEQKTNPKEGDVVGIATTPPPPPPVDKCQDYDDNNFFLGGVHAGYNWEKDGPYIFGLEGDVDFADNIDYLATMRGRIGYVYESALIYATAGVAFINYDDVFGDESDTGFVVGAGFEKKLRDDLSFGIEGLYYAFDDREFEDYCENYSKDGDFWAIRARLSYHFNDAPYEPLK